MSRYTIENFVDQTCQQDRGEGLFELETARMLELIFDGSIWTKMGTMVSCRGNLRLTREGIMVRGVGNLLKKAVSGEGVILTKAEARCISPMQEKNHHHSFAARVDLDQRH